MDIDGFRQDLRVASRALTRARAFSLTVIAVTALGVGANTAAFSVADFVLMRPLPFPEPDDLVQMCEVPVTGGGWGCNNQLSPADYLDLKAMQTSFEAMGAFAGDAVNLVGGGEPRRLSITPATPEVLPLVGVAPAIGRLFTAEDLNTVVISYALWQSQFGGDPRVLGTKVTLNGTPFTVIGVMPQSFYFPNRDVQAWTLLTFRDQDLESRANSYLEAVGRLKPGVALEQARSEMQTIAARLAAQYPETNGESSVSVNRTRDNMSPRIRLMLLTLGGASLCLLLLTCSNLASLLLARAAAQERELAVRAALGASGQRLVRQLITQSTVLATLGGIAGLAIAVAIVPLFATLVPPSLPIATQPALDLRVLTLAAIFTGLTAVLFGVWPALRAGRTGFSALRDGSRTGGGARQRVRAALVVVEVALSVVLLISAGLLIRAVSRVQSINPGFVADQVLTLRTALPRPKYDSPIRRSEYYERVLGGVRALPGVQSAGMTSGLPMLVQGLVTGVEIPGRQPDRRDSPVSHRWITPDYFKTMGIPLLRGRDVEDADTRDRAFVAVVSQSFVARYWPGQDPIGQPFRHRGETRTVVGVVGDVKVRGLERNNEPQLYLPAQQIPDGWPMNFDPKDLVIKHSGAAESLLGAVREIVRAADPEQPISNVRALDEVLAGDTATRRAQVQVLGVLAVVAILLAGVGIYGLLAYMVAQRAQEIGVRLALGAEPAQLGRMILADGMRLAAIGIVPGVLGAYAAGRAMSALLFGIAPGDPAAFATGVGLAVAMTLAGSIVPSGRAVRVTPMSVLKME